MDALTKVLVSLYEEAEKPDDALQYPLLVYITFITIFQYMLCFAQHICVCLFV
jgi:hypothetical protein